MSFTGFPAETQQFFAELNANNNREWFKAHRLDYDEFVVAPALSFVEAMIAPLGLIEPEIVVAPRINGSLRRIYRDTRFSGGKTPFHTHLHLIFWLGAHPLHSPGFHVVLGADHARFVAGHWSFSPRELDRYRTAVADEHNARVLLDIIGAAEQVGIGASDPPALKEVPAGYDPDCTGATLLRHKGILIKSAENNSAPICGPSAVSHCEGLVRAALPLVRWLSDTVYR